MNNLSIIRGPYIQNYLNNTMKTKQRSKSEKSVVISSAQITKMGLKVFSKFLKTLDDAKKTKITIKMEKV